MFVSTSLSAHQILDLLDDPAQIAAAQAGPVWITTDRQLRAQAVLYARTVALYEQQVTELLHQIRLPRSALVYRSSRLTGLTPPPVVAELGAPPGWKLQGRLLVPSRDGTADSFVVARLFNAAEYRPDLASSVDGFRHAVAGGLIDGNGALVFVAEAEDDVVDGGRWEKIPADLWHQVQKFAEEDIADLPVPRTPTRP